MDLHYMSGWLPKWCGSHWSHVVWKWASGRGWNYNLGHSRIIVMISHSQEWGTDFFRRNQVACTRVPSRQMLKIAPLGNPIFWKWRSQLEKIFGLGLHWCPLIPIISNAFTSQSENSVGGRPVKFWKFKELVVSGNGRYKQHCQWEIHDDTVDAP